MSEEKKKSGSGVRWAVRIIVLIALAYFFHPIVMPPQGEPAPSNSADDRITWRFSESGAANIYQELQLYRDGRHTITITREKGDPDIPDGGGWNPKTVQGTNLIRFHKDTIIDQNKGERLFQQAIDAGVVNLEPLEAAEPDSGSLQITTVFGGQQDQVTGPGFVSRAYHWNPAMWKQRIRWQRLGLLLLEDTELKPLMSKREIILVDE